MTDHGRPYAGDNLPTSLPSDRPHFSVLNHRVWLASDDRTVWAVPARRTPEGRTEFDWSRADPAAENWALDVALAGAGEALRGAARARRPDYDPAGRDALVRYDRPGDLDGVPFADLKARWTDHYVRTETLAPPDLSRATGTATFGAGVHVADVRRDPQGTVWLADGRGTSVAIGHATVVSVCLALHDHARGRRPLCAADLGSPENQRMRGAR